MSHDTKKEVVFRKQNHSGSGILRSSVDQTTRRGGNRAGIPGNVVINCGRLWRRLAPCQPIDELVALVWSQMAGNRRWWIDSAEDRKSKENLEGAQLVWERVNCITKNSSQIAKTIEFEWNGLIIKSFVKQLEIWRVNIFRVKRWLNSLLGTRSWTTFLPNTYVQSENYFRFSF